MTLYRVTMTMRGKRIAMKEATSETTARLFMQETNRNYKNANARVVKDSDRVRRMIP